MSTTLVGRKDKIGFIVYKKELLVIDVYISTCAFVLVLVVLTENWLQKA